MNAPNRYLTAYECPKPLLDSYDLSQRNNRNLIVLHSHKTTSSTTNHLLYGINY